MGLDVIAFKPDSKEKLSENIINDFSKIDLIRGLCAGYYPFAFRGNCYDEWIKEVTGISHYSKKIFKTKTIQKMYDLLKKSVMPDKEPELPKETSFFFENRDKDAKKSFSDEISDQEKQHIVLFFHLVLKHELNLYND